MNRTRISLAVALLAAQSAAQHSVDRSRLQSALERWNARAEAPFELRASTSGIGARDLVGGRIQSSASDPETAARALLSDHAELFALGSNLTVRTRVLGDDSKRVALTFEHASLSVEGAYTTISFDALGRVVSAHSFAPPSSVELGAFDVPASDATAIATEALEAQRARLGRTTAVNWRGANAAAVWTPLAQGLAPTWRVDFAAPRGEECYSVYVDAAQAASVRMVERTYRATGNYPFFGQMVSFPVGAASGSAFLNVKTALLGKPSAVTLGNWSLGIGAPVSLAKGFLTGARVDVYDDTNQFLISPTGKFGVPLVTQPDAWDQENVYFQIENDYAHLKKQLGLDLASNFSLPVFVNVKDTTPNAYFTSDTFPDGHSDGYLVFFDLDQLVGPAGDFARDPAVVDHEYTHAWIHYEGEEFSGNLDEPTRAVGEAIPDFFALCKQNDTVIGRYIDQQFPTLGIARDLQSNQYFIDTLNEAIPLSSTGMPEEHHAGEVFGALLVDLRLRLGITAAERLVYRALPGMPNTMAEIGYATVDTSNMIQAAADYDGTCVQALYDAAANFPASKLKIQRAVLGAASARGILGSAESTQRIVTDLAAQPKGTLAFTSAFVQPGESQRFYFIAPQNALLLVKLQAPKTVSVHPDFALAGALGEANPYQETSSKVSSGDLRTVVEKGIRLLLPTGTVYVLDVSSANAAPGKFVVTLDV